MKNKEKYNVISFSNLVEAGFFCNLFGSLKYSKIINESTITKNLKIIQAIPKIKTYYKSYTKRLIRIKLLCIDEELNKYYLNYILDRCISKDGLYFTIKKYYVGLADKIKGDIKVTYTAKSKLIISCSKDIEDIIIKAIKIILK